MPHSRRNTDACNDETFGSIESASEDRVEEERRRRGITSFSNIMHGSYGAIYMYATLMSLWTIEF